MDARYKNDGRVRALSALPDEAGGLEPVHVGHENVHENDSEFMLQNFA